MAKREANAERAEKKREAEIRSWAAKYLAFRILDGRDRQKHSKRHSKLAASLGQFLWKYNENFLPECLRMTADILEKKPSSPEKVFLRHYPRNWYDEKIKQAWEEAWDPYLEKMLSRRDFPRVIEEAVMEPERYSGWWPSFSEVVAKFREKNPNLQASERSLRRAMRRLRLSTRPGSPGRPKKK